MLWITGDSGPAIGDNPGSERDLHPALWKLWKTR